MTDTLPPLSPQERAEIRGQWLYSIARGITDPGDVVIDPVAGSASTLIAAEILGRKGYGLEIKKDMFAKANERMQAMRKQMRIF